MEDSIRHEEDVLLKRSEKLQKTNFLLTIILVIILSVTTTVGFIYKDTLFEFFSQGVQQKQTPTMLKTDETLTQTSTASAVTTGELEAYKSRSVNYYNCKHGYTFYYPQEWTNDGVTSDSDVVTFFGNGVTAHIQAYPNTEYAVLNDDSLYAFANAKTKTIEGEETGSRDKDRNGIHILAYAFTNPQSLEIYWQEKNYQIEMVFSGAWGNTEESNIQFLISTFKPGAYNIPECQQQITVQPTILSESTIQPPAPCSFPNGDVEYWWAEASEETRNCFLKQGGIAPY